MRSFENLPQFDAAWICIPDACAQTAASSSTDVDDYHDRQHPMPANYLCQVPAVRVEVLWSIPFSRWDCPCGTWVSPPCPTSVWRWAGDSRNLPKPFLHPSCECSFGWCWARFWWCWDWSRDIHSLAGPRDRWRATSHCNRAWGSTFRSPNSRRHLWVVQRVGWSLPIHSRFRCDLISDFRRDSGRSWYSDWALPTLRYQQSPHRSHGTSTWAIASRSSQNLAIALELPTRRLLYR